MCFISLDFFVKTAKVQGIAICIKFSNVYFCSAHWKYNMYQRGKILKVTDYSLTSFMNDS